MKCFEIVQRVLDDTYDEIPGSEKERDAAISTALSAMSKQYADLINSGGPDFSNPVTRFAYVFCYVPSHAHWLHELISWSQEVQSIFRNSKMRVTCLGGGPGSDLVGILKFMSSLENKPGLFCELVDGCSQWKSTWGDLAHNIDWPSSVHTDYVVHDVCDRQSWNAPHHFRKSDIFTVNFFASEIFPLGKLATDYLNFALGHAKRGSLVLINDNNDSRFHKWVDGIFGGLGFANVLSRSGTRKIYDQEEQSSAVGRYAVKFRRHPRLKGELFSRVFVKQ